MKNQIKKQIFEIPTKREKLWGCSPLRTQLELEISKIIDKEFDNFINEWRSKIKRLNIVHEKFTCSFCDGFREYGKAITDVLIELEK